MWTEPAEVFLPPEDIGVLIEALEIMIHGYECALTLFPLDVLPSRVESIKRAKLLITKLIKATEDTDSWDARLN